MPVELASGLGAVALFAAPGYGLSELVPELRLLPVPRRAAYGYLLGVAAVAGGLYGLSHVLGVPLRPPAVWCTAAAPCLAGLTAAAVRWSRGRRGGRGERAAGGERGRSPSTRLARLAEWVCVLLAALVCAGLVAEAASDPIHDWDGRMTWSAQARYLRAEGSVDAGVLTNERVYISHPQYPLLLPVAQVAALEAFRAGPDSHLQRALYAAFFPAFLLVIYDGARRAGGRTAAALTALAAAAVPFFTYGEGGAFSTYSDLPLACFYGAAASLLLWPRPRPGSAIAAGILLAGAALSKNEGALLALAALAVGWRAGAGRRAALVRLGVAALPFAAALALLFSWRAGIPNRFDEDYPDILRTGDLGPGALAKVAVFGPVLLRQMLRYHHWSGFWAAVAVLLAAGRRCLRHPLVRRRLLLAVVPPGIACAAYTVHFNPSFLASVTWERFLLQGSVPLFVVLAAALAQCARQLRPAAAPPPAP